MKHQLQQLEPSAVEVVGSSFIERSMTMRILINLGKLALVFIAVFALLALSAVSVKSTFAAPSNAPAQQTGDDPEYGKDQQPVSVSVQRNNASPSIAAAELPSTISGDPRWYRKSTSSKWNIHTERMPETKVDWQAFVNGAELKKGSVVVSGTQDLEVYKEKLQLPFPSSLLMRLTANGQTWDFEYTLPAKGPVFGWVNFFDNSQNCARPTFDVEGVVDPWALVYVIKADGTRVLVKAVFLGTDEWRTETFTLLAEYGDNVTVEVEFYGKKNADGSYDFPRGNVKRGPLANPAEICAPVTTPTPSATPSPTEPTTPTTTITPTVPGTTITPTPSATPEPTPSVTPTEPPVYGCPEGKVKDRNGECRTPPTFFIDAVATTDCNNPDIINVTITDWGKSGVKDSRNQQDGRLLVNQISFHPAGWNPNDVTDRTPTFETLYGWRGIDPSVRNTFTFKWSEIRTWLGDNNIASFDAMIIKVSDTHYSFDSQYFWVKKPIVQVSFCAPTTVDSPPIVIENPPVNNPPAQPPVVKLPPRIIPPHTAGSIDLNSIPTNKTAKVNQPDVRVQIVLISILAFFAFVMFEAILKSIGEMLKVQVRKN